MASICPALKINFKGDVSDMKIRLAVISDIHGNRWALESVLKDIKSRGAVRNNRTDWEKPLLTGRI